MATGSSGAYIPVPFWQMKPCVSSVQLRSSQRPVKWAEGLCRTTAQLVWGEGATQGNPGAFDTTAPWRGGWGWETGKAGERRAPEATGTEEREQCPHRLGATGSRAGAGGLSWRPVGIQQRFLFNPLEVPLRGVQANPKVKGHTREAGCDEG